MQVVLFMCMCFLLQDVRRPDAHLFVKMKSDDGDRTVKMIKSYSQSMNFGPVYSGASVLLSTKTFELRGDIDVRNLSLKFNTLFI